MNRKLCFLRLVAGIFSFFAIASSFAQGTAFLYQGQLNNGGSAANGSYDFAFSVFDAGTNGNLLGSPVTNDNVAVNNGLFTTTVDFGPGIFTGPTNRWLSVAVSTNGTTFTTLYPLQPVLAVPYAIFANSASNLVGVLPANLLAGGYTNAVALTNGANLFSGAFSGNGAAVTNVNVTNLTGVLAAAQLPSNTAFLSSNQTFTASNTFNGPTVFTNLLGNSFSGSFFGNGLVGWIVVPGTTEQAQIDHGYILTNSQIVTVTLPSSANVGDIIRIAGAGASGWQLAQNTGQSVLGNFLGYGNNTWYQSSASALDWYDMASSADGTKMAAAIWQGSSDGIYLSANSGSSWTLSGAGSKQFHGVAMSANGTMLVGVVTNGDIYISTDSGSTWATSASAPSAGWYCVASSASGNNLVAAVYGGKIYTYVSGGSWTAVTSGTLPADGNWTSIASSASGADLVAADANVGLYTSANGGGSWSEFASAKNWVSVASSADGTKLVAVINGGGIYTSTNTGASWAQQTGAPTEEWSSVASSADGSKLVATVANGIIYTSGNWGVTWQTNNVPATGWSCVASSSSGMTLAAGITNGTIYTAEASAQTATATTTGTNGYINGSQGSAVELQYIGNGQFMPVSYSGNIWAH